MNLAQNPYVYEKERLHFMSFHQFLTLAAPIPDKVKGAGDTFGAYCTLICPPYAKFTRPAIKILRPVSNEHLRKIGTLKKGEPAPVVCLHGDER